MLRKWKKCRYRDKNVYIVVDRGDTLTLLTRDGIWAAAQDGWDRTDKFEWEKRVPREEVEFLPDDAEAM